ncbi:hypothetical protein JOM56_004523 [Amanita muscaria]
MLLDLLNRFDADQNNPNLQVDSMRPFKRRRSQEFSSKSVSRSVFPVNLTKNFTFHYTGSMAPATFPSQQNFAKRCHREINPLNQTNRRPFPRVLLAGFHHFLPPVPRVGIPYFFIDQSRGSGPQDSRLRSVASMIPIGACSCIVASIVLSASMTFLSLSDLDCVTPIVAIIFSVCSTVSTLLAIFTIKSDLKRPSQVVGRE